MLSDVETKDEKVKKEGLLAMNLYRRGFRTTGKVGQGGVTAIS